MRELTHVAEAFPEPVLLLDRRGRLVAANDRARKVLSVPGNDNGERTTLAGMVSDGEARVETLLRQWSGSGDPSPARLTFTAVEGAPKSRRCDGWCWRSDEGPVIFVRIVTGRDPSAKLGELTNAIHQLNRECTRRAQIESQLRRLLQQMNTQNTVRDMVLSQVSHDLRTPLNAIIGMSDFMMEEPFGALQDRYRSYIADIRFSGHTLLELVDKVLTLSVNSEEKTEAVELLSDLAECLENCERVVEPLARTRGLTVIIPKDVNLPRLRVDQVLLKQIIMNLLGNAVKFSAKGGRVDWIDGEALRLDVADDGPGIPEDKLGDFLARTRPSPYIASCDGAGLGLFLTKRSADAIGVALSVRNGEGRGTVASLEFPAELLEVGAVS